MNEIKSFFTYGIYHFGGTAQTDHKRKRGDRLYLHTLPDFITYNLSVQ